MALVLVAKGTLNSSYQGWAGWQPAASVSPIDQAWGLIARNY